MVNAWSLAASILDGTFEEDYPIMTDTRVTPLESDEYDPIENKAWIYESPDGGKTVYERDFGMPIEERTLIMGNDDYMTDTLSVDLSAHLDEMGIVDTYDDTVSIADVTDLTSLTSSTPTVTIGGWDQPYENNKIRKCKKKLPKDLYKKYGLTD